jgi:DNA-binding HxlR family transcriptional regulator
MLCNIDNCNIYDAQKYIKHKWVPIIIFCINREVDTFSGLLQSIEHISNAQLSRALSLLINDEIIRLDKKQYLLCKKGQKLNEIIDLMALFEK